MQFLLELDLILKINSAPLLFIKGIEILRCSPQISGISEIHAAIGRRINIDRTINRAEVIGEYREITAE